MVYIVWPQWHEFGNQRYYGPKRNHRGHLNVSHCTKIKTECQNGGDEVNTLLRGKFIASNAYLEKSRVENQWYELPSQEAEKGQTD